MVTFLVGSFFFLMAVLGVHDIFDSLGLFDEYFIYLRKISKKHWYYDDFTFHYKR